jgi:hypothetical protein
MRPITAGEPTCRPAGEVAVKKNALVFSGGFGAVSVPSAWLFM